ncbi:tyrosine-type recombinase/integrase [Roseovarius nitratireducens]|uniref:tyrosine-type recombinase/integrase n=1 Tax=Roseovarius nitratireducens TaxID=2044597 RepID=UPI001F0CBE5F|nr:integrase arm-type DNA-binding domain-containing protein [Roseovarius nitratireducens]
MPSSKDRPGVTQSGVTVAYQMADQIMGNLTAVAIRKAGPGRLGDGKGLELHKGDTTGKWVWRYSFAGKRRQMGLGTWPDVSLADARAQRDRWASVLTQDRDPITERRAAIESARAEIERDDPTLETLTRDVFEARKAILRAEGKAGRWLSPLENHIFPKIGRKPISTVRQHDIKAALERLWRTKHPTATKAIRRLRIIFQQGKLMGYDCDPFTVDAAKHMLGAVIHTPEPIPATPWQDIPDLFARLEGRGTTAACLRFMILTLVRASGCRGARFDEIEGDLWTVPAARMKGQVGKVRDFRVPLSDAAMEIVEARRALGGEYLFAISNGNPVSDAGLSKFMRDMGEPGRPHGFRTSFRTWVQDTDATGWEVSETVLAHTIGGRVERSYARSDMLERRRPVMQAWADYVTGAEADSTVVRLGK